MPHLPKQNNLEIVFGFKSKASFYNSKIYLNEFIRDLFYSPFKRVVLFTVQVLGAPLFIFKIFQVEETANFLCLSVHT